MPARFGDLRLTSFRNSGMMMDMTLLDFQMPKWLTWSLTALVTLYILLLIILVVVS